MTRKLIAHAAERLAVGGARRSFHLMGINDAVKQTEQGIDWRLTGAGPIALTGQRGNIRRGNQIDHRRRPPRWPPFDVPMNVDVTDRQRGNRLP